MNLIRVLLILRSLQKVALANFFAFFIFINSGCYLTASITDSSTSSSGQPSVTPPADVLNPNLHATISGGPADNSSDASMNITIGGTDITAYRYKWGSSITTICSIPSGYSTNTPILTLITDSLVGNVGTLIICVLGVDASGAVQPAATASSYTWTKTWSPQIFIEAPGKGATDNPNVTLSIHAPSNYTEMFITDLAGCGSGGLWEPVAATKAKSLNIGQLNSNAIIYAKFRDASLNESTCISDSIYYAERINATMCTDSSSNSFSGILYDSGGSSGNYSPDENCTFNISFNGKVTFNDPSVAITEWEEYLDFYRGPILSNDFIFGTTGPYSIDPHSIFGTSTTINFTSDSSTEDTGFELEWQSSEITDSTSISINAGAEYTTSPNVTLTIDPPAEFNEMYITSDPTCASGGVWESASTTKARTLTFVNSSNTVAIRFRDPEGGLTPCEVAKIKYISSLPIASLSGTPTDNSGDNDTNITVSGTNVDFYRYKLGQNVPGGYCNDLTGYTVFKSAIADPLITDLTSFLNGPMTLCVLGYDSLDISQRLVSPTVYTWYRYVPSTIEFKYSGAIVNEGAGSVTFTLIANSPPPLPITVNYHFFGPLVNSLGLAPGSVVLPALQTEVNVIVPIVNNLAVSTDKTLNITISEVSSPHIIGSQGYSTVLVKDAQRSSTLSVSKIAPDGKCIILTTGELLCHDRWGTYNGVYSMDYERVSAPTLFKEIVAGTDHHCALSTADELYCWGWGFDGQLGLGNQSSFDLPQKINGFTWKKIAASSWTNTCGIDTNDDLYCWGDQTFSHGTGGNGTTNDSLIPTLIDAGTKYKKLYMGWHNACAITMADDLKCWGANESGQMGDGGTTDQYAPFAVDAGTKYIEITTPDRTICGVTTTGAIKCWGQDLMTWNPIPQLPTVIDNSRVYTSITTDSFSWCALDTTSHLYCFGATYIWDAFQATPALADPDDTYSKISNFCGISSLGKLKCWGGLYYPLAAGKALLYDSDTFAEIFPNSCAITTSGFAKCKVNDEWGSVMGTFYEVPISGLTAKEIVGTINWKKLSTHAYSYGSCGIDASNDLYCWGMPVPGKAGETNPYRPNPVKVPSSVGFMDVDNYDLSACAVETDGDLYCWDFYNIGASSNELTLIDSGVKYSKIKTDGYTVCGITQTGALKCGGSNGDGQLGLGDTTDRNVMAVVDSGTQYIDVNMRGGWTCGITSLKKLKCWGLNTNGIGDGSTSSLLPVAVDAAEDYREVAFYNGTACAIRDSDGRLKCWGSAYVGDGTSTVRSTPTLTTDTTPYKKIFGTCGVTDGGSPEMRCFGYIPWHANMEVNPVSVYSGDVLGFYDFGFINSTGQFYFLGRPFSVPGIHGTGRYFEPIQGAIDRVAPNH